MGVGQRQEDGAGQKEPEFGSQSGCGSQGHCFPAVGSPLGQPTSLLEPGSSGEGDSW